MKKLSYVSAFAALVFLFLAMAGCAQSPPAASPSAPGYSAPAPIAPAVPAETGQAPPAVPANSTGIVAWPPPPTGCSVLLNQSVSRVGDIVTVRAHAYANPGQEATYLCGSKTITMGTGGLFDELRDCTFSQAGNVSVWVALGSQTCASAALQVLPRTGTTGLSGSCQIVASSRQFNATAGTWTYSAQVRYANYSPNSTLYWNCEYHSASQNLGALSPDAAAGATSGTARLNCEYDFNPRLVDALPVYIDNDYCGDILR
ncbi:MAG: hypothetical protein KGH63_03590 [Candidatus Micrarchaeota archaeon]|nr:hypothetical protein [Candidatus Micrarchaeota archaeon]